MTLHPLPIASVNSGKPKEAAVISKFLKFRGLHLEFCCSWVARMDPPLVRAAVRDLGVGVRTITEAPMRGISVLAFWESLGMCHAHECIKAGRTYSIDVQHQTLQASSLG